MYTVIANINSVKLQIRKFNFLTGIISLRNIVKLNAECRLFSFPTNINFFTKKDAVFLPGKH